MRVLFFIVLLCLCLCGAAQELFIKPPGVQSRVSSFENPNGTKGQGGKTNKGAKGNAFEWLHPGGSKTLLDIQGQGIIQRIWLTVNQSPRLLRSLRLRMFWDCDPRPAVDVPLGDFFVSSLGRPAPFESDFFASPEGRSYNCFIPMPFRKGARITLVNESVSDTGKLFYDVDYLLTERLPAGALYFHAYWTRQITSKLGDDFLVLPRVQGSGRFLGMSVGLNTDSVYAKTWWGEGEVKMYLDGDKAYPTIAGTGAEDYSGTGWGMGVYSNRYQGCTVADEAKGQFAFYRWHIPDAIYFNSDLRITLQQIGGGPKDVVRSLVNRKVPLKPISVDNIAGFVRLLDRPLSINDKDFPEGWVNFYRVDDYCAVSYFYLDKTSTSLPDLPPIDQRIQNLK